MFSAILLACLIVPVDADVEVSIEAPKTVDITKTETPGGKVGSAKVKVTVKNLGNEAIVFSQSKVKVTVLENKKDYVGGYNAEPQKTFDAGQIKKDQKRSCERDITFHTRMPDDGDKLTIVAEFEGKKAEAVVTVKRK